MKLTYWSIVLVVFILFITGCNRLHRVHSALHVDHNHSGSETMNASDTESQEWAKQRLAKSPRHQEWVKVKYTPAGGKEREVNAFVVYPEVKNKTAAVIVIHEIFGMSDWVQSLTDELAEAGYIAIAPDLLSGMGPNGGGTSDVASKGSNAVGQAIRDLPPDQITADLNATADYVSKLPAANGKLAVAGFCWGGGQSFRYATNNSKLSAAFVFYGSAPMTGNALPVDRTAIAKIAAPVYGFYARNDAHIDATIPDTIAAMKEQNKKYDPVTYDGAGHGFMRAGDAPAPSPSASPGNTPASNSSGDDTAMKNYMANQKARNDAWARWKSLLAKI